MIDYITPQWSGSLYGETLLCDEMPQHSMGISSPQAMLETFYDEVLRPKPFFVILKFSCVKEFSKMPIIGQRDA